MARTNDKALDTTILLPISEAAHAETLFETQLDHIGDAYSQERDLVNEMIGEAKAFDAMAKFSRTVRTFKLSKIKENKHYRALKGRKSPNGSEFSGTWAEFCSLLGYSPDLIDQDIANLNAFGEDAFDALTRVGAGYREMRKLRQLPEDVREQLIEGRLVDLTDKEDVIALIDEVTQEKNREIVKLSKSVQSLEQDAEATDKVLGDKSTKIDQLEKDNHKLRSKAIPWNERVFDISLEVTRVGTIAAEAFDQLDALREAILNEDFGEQDREAAVDHLAVTYFDIIDGLYGRASQSFAECQAVFMGYKDKPMRNIETLADVHATNHAN